MPHFIRPAFASRHPATSLFASSPTSSLRSPRLVHEFERSIARLLDRADFRLVHYSLQSNHVHLLIEASHRIALARGMKAVGARLARAVNRVFRRAGPVLATATTSAS